MLTTDRSLAQRSCSPATPNTPSHASAAPATSTGRRQVIAAAHTNRQPNRKKPGRVAGKQSGTTYYQNYLRNRREKGGELLGPPLPLPLQLGGEQPPIAQQPTRDVPEQQHQQQQQIEAAQGVISPPSSDAAVIDATRLQQLLEQCLAAATPTTPPPVSLQQQPPLTPAQQQRLLSKQRQPWQLPDYVSPELADGMVQLLKRRRGVKVEPPELTTVEPLVPLPPLPPLSDQRTSTTTSSSSDTSREDTTTASAATTNTGAATDAAPAHQPQEQQQQQSRRRRVLHVFWDLSSLHPGAYDPRLVVAQLRRVLSCYGEVAGVYAYGIQKLFNWVPEAFMAQYAPDRLPGRRSRQQQQQQLLLQQRQQQLEQQQQQQQPQQPAIGAQFAPQDLQQLLQQASRVGISLEDSLGPLRCRVCGKLRDNHRQLHAHMMQRHKQAAPPLDRLLPAGALASMLVAAIAAAAGDLRSSRGGAGQRSQLSTASAPTEAAGGGQRNTSNNNNKPFSWKVADPWVMRNSSTRTLGRVNRYFNSRSEQFLPPDGHQISLKYVLVREGVEVRTVQRAERAVSAAVADALAKTLHGLLLGRSAQEVQEVQDVFVVISDKGTQAAVLQEARRAGLQVIAVCGKVKKQQGADVTLRWQWVATGRYDWEPLVL